MAKITERRPNVKHFFVERWKYGASCEVDQTAGESVKKRAERRTQALIGIWLEGRTLIGTASQGKRCTRDTEESLWDCFAKNRLVTK